MTLAELDRFFQSRARVLKAQERKQASYDYILADLIGRSVARVYNSSNKLPTINEAYPTLFTEEELKARRAELNRQRFMAGLQQFAHTHNNDIGGGKG